MALSLRDVITLKFYISHYIIYRSESLKREIEVVRDICKFDTLLRICNTSTDFYLNFYPFVPFQKMGNSQEDRAILCKLCLDGKNLSEILGRIWLPQRNKLESLFQTYERLCQLNLISPLNFRNQDEPVTRVCI